MNAWDRTSWLIGQENMDRLANAKVAVCGIGGVGCAAVEALARSGVGFLRLIDSDKVEESNINRQLFALLSTVGLPKVEAAERRIADINRNCRVDVRQERLAGDNVAELLAGMDYVIDAIDDVKGKIAIISYCLKQNIRVASSMGTGNKIQPELLKIGDIAKTSVCPLARAVRRELRKEGVSSGVTVVWSEEAPLRKKAGTADGFSLGSVSFVPPVAGMLLAGAVIRQLIVLEEK